MLTSKTKPTSQRRLSSESNRTKEVAFAPMRKLHRTTARVETKPSMNCKVDRSKLERWHFTRTEDYWVCGTVKPELCGGSKKLADAKENSRPKTGPGNEMSVVLLEEDKASFSLPFLRSLFLSLYADIIERRPQTVRSSL